MILSRTYGFLFIHLPKTGGTTVSHRLAPVIDPSRDIRLTRGNERPAHWEEVGFSAEAKVHKHSGFRILRPALGPQRFDALFTFAFVRNPYARYYSAFNFLKTKAGEFWDSPDVGPFRRRFRDMTIEESIADMHANSKGTLAMRPQSFFVPRPERLDFIGRTERLDEDYRTLCDRLGLPDAARATSENRNRRLPSDAWRSMPPAVFDAVADFYAADFEKFGYDPADRGPLDEDRSAGPDDVSGPAPSDPAPSSGPA